jgi:hypothetical protein
LSRGQIRPKFALSFPADDQIIAVDHLGAAAEAEDRGDVG